MKYLISLLVCTGALFSGVICIAPTYYGLDRPSLEYELPPLSYNFDSLEPYMDSDTVQTHYLGHHAKYTENMNIALREWRRFVEDRASIRVSLIDILRNLTHIHPRFREGIKNNAGGYVNHAIIWAVMSPNVHGEERWPVGDIADDIKAYFRSFIQFRDIFSETLSVGLWPILSIDVWEHAYYLKHRNHRAKYIQEWWFLVDWDQVRSLDNWWFGIRQHDEL